MTAEYYANEYKRYATYLRNFSGNMLHKIAGGPNSADYHWTEVLMRDVGFRMWGLDLHNYTWPKFDRSATNFDEKTYFSTLHSTLRMDELITKHGTIMDKYDPNKAIALVINEWGIWTEVEPGTNPGFLYQQNSLRDALLAALNFDIFNKHADRVKMTNIAQTVNVLQAVVLTDKEKMLLTPTYHAFKFYTVHHDADFLPAYFKSPDYMFEIDGKTEKIPAISGTASRNADGVNLTLTNIDPNKSYELEIELRGGGELKSVSAEILTADKITAHNTFDSPNNVTAQNFDGCIIKDGKLTVKLEPKSLALIKINQ